MSSLSLHATSPKELQEFMPGNWVTPIAVPVIALGYNERTKNKLAVINEITQYEITNLLSEAEGRTSVPVITLRGRFTLRFRAADFCHSRNHSLLDAS